MRRVNGGRYGYRSWSEEDLKRYGKFLLLPLVVLILVIVILVADRKNRPKPEETIPEESILSEETPSDTARGESADSDDQADSGFSVGDVPQVRDLINQYFTAKQAADAETIYQLFGWDDLTGIDDLRRLLQYDARYTDGYRNITCYTRQGLTEDSYLVYVSYDLKFKNSLTLAPGLQWNYIKTNEDGRLCLTDGESLSAEELELAAKAERTDEIMLLRTEVYARLRQALEKDPSLAESYSILERQGGAAGNAQEESPHEAEVQIGTGVSVQGADIQIGTDGNAPGPADQSGNGDGDAGAEGQDGQAGADNGAPPEEGQDGQTGTGNGALAADGQAGTDNGALAADGQAGTDNGAPAADSQDGAGDGAPAIDIQTGQ